MYQNRFYVFSSSYPGVGVFFHWMNIVAAAVKLEVSVNLTKSDAWLSEQRCFNVCSDAINAPNSTSNLGKYLHWMQRHSCMCDKILQILLIDKQSAKFKKRCFT